MWEEAVMAFFKTLHRATQETRELKVRRAAANPPPPGILKPPKYKSDILLCYEDTQYISMEKILRFDYVDQTL